VEVRFDISVIKELIDWLAVHTQFAYLAIGPIDMLCQTHFRYWLHTVIEQYNVLYVRDIAISKATNEQRRIFTWRI